jgi:RNA recognition motif-containing protein
MDTKSKTYRIFFGSLPPTCSNSDMKKLITPVAPVKLVKLIFDKVTRFCKGYGHVEFFTKEDQELVLR